MFGKLPAYGFFCRHAENITFNNVDLDLISSDARPAIVCDDVSQLKLCNLEAGVNNNVPLLRFKDVQNVLIESCVALKGTDLFLHISGLKSQHITLTGNDLSFATNALKKDDNIEVYSDFNRLK